MTISRVLMVTNIIVNLKGDRELVYTWDKPISVAKAASETVRLNPDWTSMVITVVKKQSSK